MEIGNKIKVFKLINDGGYSPLVRKLIGMSRPEFESNCDYGNYGVDLNLFLPGLSKCHFFTKKDNPEAKHVCTMVIKSIKQ